MKKIESNIKEIESQDSQIRVHKPDVGAKISRCMVINGGVKSCEPIVIDGTINGDIVSDDCVVVQKSGIVFGNIKAKKILIEGKAEGPLEANIIEIAKGATLTGYILADKIVITGNVDGDVIARELLIVEQEAKVDTYVCQAKVMIVKGNIIGEVLAKNLLDIRSNGVINGDVKVTELKTEGGSRISGSIERFGSSKIIQANMLSSGAKNQEKEKKCFEARYIG